MSVSNYWSFSSHKYQGKYLVALDGVAALKDGNCEKKEERFEKLKKEEWEKKKSVKLTKKSINGKRMKRKRKAELEWRNDIKKR